MLPETPPIEELPPVDIPLEEPKEEIIDIPKVEPEKDNSAAKAVATLAGLGATIGAAGYAGYKYIKSKEDDEEYKETEEDY